MSAENSLYQEPRDIYNKKIQSKPVPEKQVGVDTQNGVFDDIISASESRTLDVSAFTNFDQASRSRDSVYNLMDVMCQDSTISSVLGTYTEDSVERNMAGQIVWADSSDADVSKYINYLLDAMRVDKNIYKWAQSLCKYGDLYLRIYRESEYEDGLFGSDQELNRNKTLNEAVNIKAYSKDDHYVPYLEMQPNPAQVFELTKFGKSYAYIKTHTAALNATTSNGSAWDTSNVSLFNYKYSFNKNDIDVYSATEFVHGCLEDDSSRTPEEVTISINSDKDVTYQVKRGQPLFYSAFKVWRELLLLKNSVLLNRVTRSSLVRAIQVEIGDMPKEQVQPHLQGIKRLFEQSQSIISGTSMQEYTNPGPIENNVYIPTRNGKGALNVQQVGGDVNVGQLADLNYYTDVLFGALGVPKAYFAHTDDSTGFNGGESLAQISSRYAKKIKRIQDTLIQTLTDAINIILLDRNLGNYINKFTIKMQSPTTSEEIAKRDNLASKVSLTSDIMNMLSDVEDATTKLKILKALMSDYLNNEEVVTLLQQEIDKLEKAAETEEGTPEEEPQSSDILSDLNAEPEEVVEPSIEDSEEAIDLPDSPTEEPEEIDLNSEVAVDVEEEEPETLPAPNQLGLDFTDSSNF